MNLTPETAPAGGEAGGWISFVEASAVAETERAIVAEKPAEDASVNVLTFDESTGLQLKNQVEFAAAQATTKLTPAELPWKVWHQEHRCSMGRVEADKATAVAVLHGLHEMYDVTKNAI